jgi:hypothetical protein
VTGLVQAFRLWASSLHLVAPDALKVNVAVEEVVEFEGAEVIVTDGACCQCACGAQAPRGRTGQDECCQPEGRKMRGTTFARAKDVPGGGAPAPCPDFGNDPRAESLNRGAGRRLRPRLRIIRFMATVPEVSRTTAIRMREGLLPRSAVSGSVPLRSSGSRFRWH